MDGCWTPLACLFCTCINMIIARISLSNVIWKLNNILNDYTALIAAIVQLYTNSIQCIHLPLYYCSMYDSESRIIRPVAERLITQLE